MTEALWKQDVEAATEAKHEVSHCFGSLGSAERVLTRVLPQLEEKQRADKSERQRLGVEWKQAVGTSRSCLCTSGHAVHLTYPLTAFPWRGNILGL